MNTVIIHLPMWIAIFILATMNLYTAYKMDKLEKWVNAKEKKIFTKNKEK